MAYTGIFNNNKYLNLLIYYIYRWVGGDYLKNKKINIYAIYNTTQSDF